MMEDFDRYAGAKQTEWKRKILPKSGEGTQIGKKRPWILPVDSWEDGLWAGIRSGANSLPDYLERTGVQKHDGVHNLKSSWMQCANLYFPFRDDRQMVARFLKENASPLIDSVDKIELEWAEDAPFDPTTLLGEPQGQRGRNQTSPDIAFVVNGGKGIVLVENKYTEHSFYPCSGRKAVYGNPDPGRCMNLTRLYSDLPHQCYLLQWANGNRTNRKYWDYLSFTPEALAELKRCPAATAGYQIFRQQALAEALVRRRKYDFAISCVAYDARNTTLIECLAGTGIRDFTTGWAPLFHGEAGFSTFTHQMWVKWVSESGGARWGDWLEYVRGRYGLPS